MFEDDPDMFGQLALEPEWLGAALLGAGAVFVDGVVVVDVDPLAAFAIAAPPPASAPVAARATATDLMRCRMLLTSLGRGWDLQSTPPA